MKLESIVRYRGIEVDDALEMAEQAKILMHRPASDCSPVTRPLNNARKGAL
ncbi:hypothetical protein [Achromobacter xylosoxidans]|uniref:hypothetical protein n=1 Tax=Alcaligenes xylosoxydans xylosoxydans TaxID=85698 RepID=UPI000A9E6A7C